MIILSEIEKLASYQITLIRTLFPAILFYHHRASLSSRYGPFPLFYMLKNQTKQTKKPKEHFSVQILTAIHLKYTLRSCSPLTESYCSPVSIVVRIVSSTAPKGLCQTLRVQVGLNLSSAIEDSKM